MTAGEKQRHAAMFATLVAHAPAPAMPAAYEGSEKAASGRDPVRPQGAVDAATDLYKQAGITKRVQQAGIIEEWAELVGPQIASVTEPRVLSGEANARSRVDPSIAPIVKASPTGHASGGASERVASQRGRGDTGRQPGAADFTGLSVQPVGRDERANSSR